MNADSLNGQVQIGTPSQHLDVRFDLGSSAIILNSAGFYNSSVSSSFIDRDYRIGTEFSDGSSAQISLANESFNIGGTIFNNVPFSQLSEFSEYDPPFGGAEGILGLNFVESQGFQFTYNPSFMQAVKEYLPGKSPDFTLGYCD